MAELTQAPELVEPATDSTSDPAPVDGQPAETPAEPTPPESFHVGDSDYTMDELVTHLETSKNASAMHTAAHERNTAANEALEKALAIQNDEELQELKTILTAIKRDSGMNSEWDAMRHGGGPMAMEVRLEQMESKLGGLLDENAGMKADDVLGQFAKAHGLTEQQAKEEGAKFLAETKAEQFPDGTTVLDQLDYFHWKNYGQQGQADALTAATKAGYDDAIGRVKAGHAAELGSPATAAAEPWEPPADADERPMLASELAALADDGIIFPEDGDVLE